MESKSVQELIFRQAELVSGSHFSLNSKNEIPNQVRNDSIRTVSSSVTSLGFIELKEIIEYQLLLFIKICVKYITLSSSKATPTPVRFELLSMLLLCPGLFNQAVTAPCAL